MKLLSIYARIRNFKSYKFCLLYSLSYCSLILAPNIFYVMPSNYTYYPISLFFFLFILIFFIILICEELIIKDLSIFVYLILFLFCVDYLRLKYQIISFENNFYLKLIKENIILIFSILFFFIIRFNIIYKSIAFFIKFFIIFFFPFFFFVLFYYFQIYSDLNKKIELNNIEIGNKKTLILVFDELDRKILKKELDLLPAFKYLYENSIIYEGINVPGYETYDVLLNVINLKEDTFPLKLKNKYLNKEYIQFIRLKKNYLDKIKIIKDNNNSLLNLLNTNNELFIFGYFHKFCYHFTNYGECYEFKYKKLPIYRGLIVKDAEILQTHINNYKKVFELTDFFFSSQKLKSGFFHLPFPHPPFIYNYEKKKFEKIYEDTNGYLGNLYLSDKYLQYILDKKKKIDFDLIVMSDHGFRGNYKDIKSITNMTYDEVQGRAFLSLLLKNKKNEIVKEEKGVIEILNNYFKYDFQYK